MTRRRGFSLIELVLALSVGVVLLGIGIGLIHTLMRLDRADRARLAEEARLDRLIDAFRADVHAATGLGPDAARDLMSLTLPGGVSVSYRAGPGSLARTRRAGDDRREERFPLPSWGVPRLEVEPDGPRTVARLALDRAPGRVGPRALRVEAVVGFDHRFAGAGDEGK